MATLVATNDDATGTVRIDVETTEVRDLFTRVVVAGWGNATTGQAWAISGGVAAEFSVNGTQGLMSLASTAVSRRAAISTTVGSNMFAHRQVTVPVVALTQPIIVEVMFRHTSIADTYLATLSLAPTTDVASLSIRKIVGSVTTTISAVVPLPQVHAAGATWFIEAECCGTSLRARAWRSTVTRPNWVVTAVDGDLTTGSLSGVRSMLVTGNTNVLPVVIVDDNFVSTVSNPFRLYRVTADGVRTEVRGSPGNAEEATAAAPTSIATFWDSEAPFDTPIFYELTSNCSSTVEATSNTVTLNSGGDGWLRDAVNPSLNVRIDFSGDLFDFCEEDVDQIAFGGFGQREYTNSSGLFDIVDAERVQVVAQTRKRYGSTMVLVSKTFNDEDAIEAILKSGRPLLLSLPLAYDFGRPYGTDWIGISDATSAIIGVDGTITARTWTLPFRLAYELRDTSEGGTGGNGIGGGDATYEVLAASVLGTTYATLTASGETFQQVSQGVGY
jgi:hypothetical protein